jgi:O-antigen ligase
VNPAKNARFRLVMGAACAISVIGMFMAGPRLPLIQLVGSALILLILPGLTSSERFRLGWRIAAVAAVAFIYVAADPRMQRFTTLSDPKMVEERATMSLNFSLGESFQKLPMGVGLGGAAGSSMPYFLKDVAPIPIGAENEYARIAIEQGIVGFLIWMAFVLRLVVRPPKPLTPRWRTGLFFAWATVLVAWGTAWIGLGMLQSIPASIILLFSSGMLLRSSPRKVPAPAQSPLPERFQPAPLPGASNPMLPPGGI